MTTDARTSVPALINELAGLYSFSRGAGVAGWIAVVVIGCPVRRYTELRKCLRTSYCPVR